MKKIRDKNDFYFVWAVERNGIPENLNSRIDAKLTLSGFNKKEVLVFAVVDTNKIGIEFKKAILTEPGVYNLEFSYTLPDTGFSDGIRTCTVDLDPFQIVPRSKDADDSSQFTYTSDVAIAFKGDKGDAFTFDDFTPEQLESLKVKGDKGDAFTYEDFTPEQIESLKVKGDTGPMADVSMAVNESGELIATINN